MKYCSKCGNALNDDMAFCPKCGEACIEQPTSPADQKLRDLESIHIILPKEELSWEYIRTHKDIGAIFAKQEKLAQQAVEIGKECMTLASMDEYNKIQEGVYRFYLQNAYALIDLAACLYEDSTELDAMWNEFKSLVAKGQLDAQKFINDMSSTDANYEIYAGLQILLSSYFTEALDSSVVADNESYQQAVVDILKRYTEALSLYLNRLKSHSWAPQPSFHDSHRELFDKMLAKLPRPEPILTVKVSGSDVRLRYRDIIFAEHFAHMINIRTTAGKTLATRQSFKAFTEPLKKDPRFFVCSRGVIVNLEHAADFQAAAFCMTDGSRVYVNQELLKPARQAFMEFLLQGGV